MTHFIAEAELPLESTLFFFHFENMLKFNMLCKATFMDSCPTFDSLYKPTGYLQVALYSLKDDVIETISCWNYEQNSDFGQLQILFCQKLSLQPFNYFMIFCSGRSSKTLKPTIMRLFFFLVQNIDTGWLIQNMANALTVFRWTFL